MQKPGKVFSTTNGREVFENAGRKMWRCPVCAWWREWETLSCCACGTHRDGHRDAPPRRVFTARNRAAGHAL